MITLEGGIFLSEKKTAVITVRIPPSTREAIAREAEKNDWSASKMAEKILTAWAKQQNEPEAPK